MGAEAFSHLGWAVNVGDLRSLPSLSSPNSTAAVGGFEAVIIKELEKLNK